MSNWAVSPRTAVSTPQPCEPAAKLSDATNNKHRASRTYRRSKKSFSPKTAWTGRTVLGALSPSASGDVLSAECFGSPVGVADAVLGIRKDAVHGKRNIDHDVGSLTDDSSVDTESDESDDSTVDTVLDHHVGCISDAWFRRHLPHWAERNLPSPKPSMETKLTTMAQPVTVQQVAGTIRENWFSLENISLKVESEAMLIDEISKERLKHLQNQQKRAKITATKISPSVRSTGKKKKERNAPKDFSNIKLIDDSIPVLRRMLSLLNWLRSDKPYRTYKLLKAQLLQEFPADEFQHHKTTIIRYLKMTELPKKQIKSYSEDRVTEIVLNISASKVLQRMVEVTLASSVAIVSTSRGHVLPPSSSRWNCQCPNIRSVHIHLLKSVKLLPYQQMRGHVGSRFPSISFEGSAQYFQEFLHLSAAASKNEDLWKVFEKVCSSVREKIRSKSKRSILQNHVQNGERESPTNSTWDLMLKQVAEEDKVLHQAVVFASSCRLSRKAHVTYKRVKKHILQTSSDFEQSKALIQHFIQQLYKTTDA